MTLTEFTDEDGKYFTLMAILVNVLVMLGPAFIGVTLVSPPHSCFATEETYEPLYTFELFL